MAPFLLQVILLAVGTGVLKLRQIQRCPRPAPYRPRHYAVVAA